MVDAEELGVVVADIDPVRGVYEGFRKFLQGVYAGGVVFQGGDVGNNPQDGAGPE